jgi:Tfp pilus assembly protein PilE
MRARLSRRADRGETLIELIIAIAILGVCVVAIGSGIAGAVMVSGLNRDQADAGRVLHNYAETLEAATYTPCATTYALPTQTGFDAPTLDITYWNGSAFQATCPVGGDQGLQRVAITVTNTDGRVSQSLRVVLRNPS